MTDCILRRATTSRAGVVNDAFASFKGSVAAGVDVNHRAVIAASAEADRAGFKCRTRTDCSNLNLSDPDRTKRIGPGVTARAAIEVVAAEAQVRINAADVLIQIARRAGLPTQVAASAGQIEFIVAEEVVVPILLQCIWNPSL